MKIFLTVEIEKDDDSDLIDTSIDMLVAFNKKLRKKKIKTQLKFTDLPRRFEHEGFKKASEIQITST